MKTWSEILAQALEGNDPARIDVRIDDLLDLANERKAFAADTENSIDDRDAASKEYEEIFAGISQLQTHRDTVVERETEIADRIADQTPAAEAPAEDAAPAAEEAAPAADASETPAPDAPANEPIPTIDVETAPERDGELIAAANSDNPSEPAILTEIVKSELSVTPDDITFVAAAASNGTSSDPVQELANRMSSLHKTGDFSASPSHVVASASRWGGDTVSPLSDENSGAKNYDSFMAHMAAALEAKNDAIQFKSTTAAFCGHTNFEYGPDCTQDGRDIDLVDTPMPDGQIAFRKPAGIEDISKTFAYGASDCPGGVARPEGVEDPETGELIGTNPDDPKYKGDCAEDAPCDEYNHFALRERYYCLKVNRSQDISNSRGLADRLARIQAGKDRTDDALLWGQMISGAALDGQLYEWNGTVINGVSDLYDAMEKIFSLVNAKSRTSLSGWRPLFHQGLASHLASEKYKGDCGCSGERELGSVFRDLGLGAPNMSRDWARPSYVLADKAACDEPRDVFAAPVCEEPAPTVEYPADDAPLGTPIILNPAAEDGLPDCDTRCYDITLYNPAAVSRGVGRTMAVGVNGEFRDWDLTLKNQRGIFVATEETLLFGGCVPLINLRFRVAATGASVGCVPACNHPQRPLLAAALQG